MICKDFCLILLPLEATLKPHQLILKFASASTSLRSAKSRRINLYLSMESDIINAKNVFEMLYSSAKKMIQRHFSLFNSHLALAHKLWAELLQSGDAAIDATCGNGHDTLVLAKILLEGSTTSQILAFDIQAEALTRTRELLQMHLSKEALARVKLFHQSHAQFPEEANTLPVKLVIYNLGYLPRGNKNLTTMTETTLTSVRHACELICPGGAVCITCYPGHLEGAREEKALLEELKHLSPEQWSVTHHQWVNRVESPSLLLIQKQASNL